MRFDALLATALALQPLGLLGGGSSGGFESFFFCSPGALGSQSGSFSLLGLGLFGLAMLRLNPRLVNEP